jgi:hypothetical protein
MTWTGAWAPCCASCTRPALGLGLAAAAPMRQLVRPPAIRAGLRPDTEGQYWSVLLPVSRHACVCLLFYRYHVGLLAFVSCTPSACRCTTLLLAFIVFLLSLASFYCISLVLASSVLPKLKMLGNDNMLLIFSREIHEMNIEIAVAR